MRLWVPWGHRPCHIHLCFCSSRMGRDLSNGKRVFGTKYEGVSENHLSYLSAYLCPILSKSSPSHGPPTLGFFFLTFFCLTSFSHIQQGTQTPQSFDGFCLVSKLSWSMMDPVTGSATQGEFSETAQRHSASFHWDKAVKTSPPCWTSPLLTMGENVRRSSVETVWKKWEVSNYTWPSCISAGQPA